MKTLPIEFENRMKKLLGSDFNAFIKALDEPAVRAFRVNTDKISQQQFEKINPFKSQKIPYVENGYYLFEEKVGDSPFHHAGAIYVQEPAAMAPAECIDIELDWKILDMCAAPGGKSTQLRNKLGEKGILVSNEIIPSRCKILTGNIERLGLKNTVITCLSTEKLASLFPKTFDLVMVDAPCSGEGMFRKDEKAIDEWSEQNVANCAKRQKEILENAALCVKNGGYIIYATCTFSLEENEMVVDSFIKNNSEFELIPVKNSVKEATADGILFEGCSEKNIGFARRFYPHIAKGEGQFMALLHNKNDKAVKVSAKKTADKKIDRAVIEFLDDVLVSYDKQNVTMYNDNPVYFSPDFEVKKSSAFCCGVTIGEIRKGYIQPHHQFFMAMGNVFKRKIELSPDSDELKKYLHGEEFSVNCENGWAAVTVCGCTVGGVKVSCGRAKNHYPKGLRNK